jgi:hypothetical protein
VIQLTDKQKEEFYHRSYKAVDGLWFMKVEEKHGFDAALQIDERVWQVMPKIQARMLKAIAGSAGGIEALLECFTAKLSLDGYSFRVEREREGGGFAVVVEKCPWHELMIKSGREGLSGRVGSTICSTEYRIWASEFGDDIKFEIGEQICTGGQLCLLKFERSS